MHNSFPLGHRRCRFDLPGLEKVEGGGEFVTEADLVILWQGCIKARTWQDMSMKTLPAASCVVWDR